MEKNTNITDEQLIKNFQNGDVDAFDKLVNKYKDRIYNFIYRFQFNRIVTLDCGYNTII